MFHSGRSTWRKEDLIKDGAKPLPFLAVFFFSLVKGLGEVSFSFFLFFELCLFLQVSVWTMAA
jgi:hypothetical protein